jgi:uncharacterized protein YyaL (SSP411 family)
MRVLLGAGLAGAVFAGSLGLPSAGAADSDAARARLSYESMQRAFFDPRSGGYRERVGAKPGAHAWPISQALAATLAVARVPQTARVGRRAVPRLVARLDARLRKGSVYTASPGGDVFLDDNEWVAQDLLDWDAIAKSPRARRTAESIFAAVVRAWDADGSHPCPGGVYWTQGSANHDRNTVSTANGAVLGLRLYALTRRAGYLRWSQRMLVWLDDCLLDANGLFWDHIRADGSIDRSEWSYNQGSVVAAYLLLYRTTGAASALARAEAIADATLAWFAGRWNDEPPEFAAIFFRRLLDLADADGRSDYVAAAEAYADAAWTSSRDPRTGLFSSRSRPRLLDQAAYVQLYAALAAATAGR